MQEKGPKTKHDPSKEIGQHNAIGVFTKTVSKIVFVKFGVEGQGEDFFQIKHSKEESIFLKDTISFICFAPCNMGNQQWWGWGSCFSCLGF